MEPAVCAYEYVDQNTQERRAYKYFQKRGAIAIKTKCCCENIGGHLAFGSIVDYDSYYICPPGIIRTRYDILSRETIVIRTKCCCENIGGYLAFGSIVGSDSYYIGPPGIIRITILLRGVIVIRTKNSV